MFGQQASLRYFFAGVENLSMGDDHRGAFNDQGLAGVVGVRGLPAVILRGGGRTKDERPSFAALTSGLFYLFARSGEALDSLRNKKPVPAGAGKGLSSFVGVRGFEPPTSTSRT